MTEIIETIVPAIGTRQEEDREREERYNPLAIPGQAAEYGTTNEKGT